MIVGMDNNSLVALHRVATAALFAVSALAIPAGAIAQVRTIAGTSVAQPALVDTVHERVLYGFKNQDGGSPRAGLLLDKNGALYGTTSESAPTCSGGPNMLGCGTVFKLTPAGTGYAKHIIYHFAGGSDGANSFAGLIADSSGALYGTTTYGGGPGNFGTVFKLTPSPGGYVESVLYRFKGMPDGAYPQAGLIADGSGALYGTTSAGGSGMDQTCGGSQFIFGCGTVFKLTPSGSGYTESILYNFLGLGVNDGEYPVAGLIADAAGALYGTTQFGGPNFSGVVFKLTPSGSGYTESVLYHFCAKPSCTDGGSPLAGLIADNSGALYSTTNRGGDPTCNGSGHGGCGTVFKLTPSPSGYAESVLYAFKSIADGEYPLAGLIADSKGALYSTTSSGGLGTGGTVFKLTPTPKGYTKHILHSFRLSTHSDAYPVAGLVANKKGVLFGTTEYGDRAHYCTLISNGCGMVFELTP
jgi:uncharacterized repeat protein (TIGR03803 family)